MLEFAYDCFIEPFISNTFMLKAVLAGSLVAIASATVGCFIILRRMAFLGDAISHSMVAGVVCGYLLMKKLTGEDAHYPAMIIGSLLAGFFTVLLVGFVSKVSRIKDDTAIGVMYTGIFALGGMLASLFSADIHFHLSDFIMGDVLSVDNDRLWLMGTVTAIVLFVIILFYRQLKLTSFDPIMAASVGIPVTLIGYVLTTCTSLVVVGAVNIVGVILVIGLLVTPAATAYLLCNRLSTMMVVASVFGVTSVLFGVYLSEWFNFATSPAIVLFSTFQFSVVLVASPRYGLLASWIRRRRAISQHLIEDILGCLRRDDQPITARETIYAHVESSSSTILRAIKHLVKIDLLEIVSDTSYRLTEAGTREARRLMRAHRIWETYLQRLGTPESELHEKAHLLEHVHDEQTVDYLDDRLGHPLKDPHGKEIPEDFVHLVPGEVVNSSLLRAGHSGQITEIKPGTELGLAVNDFITVGPREKSNTLWNFKLPSGKVVLLDHQNTERVSVRLTGSGES
ncbi:MAG: metal ABC transporter permease [Pirellulales bacterium]